MGLEIALAVDHLNLDESCGVVVVTGEGDVFRPAGDLEMISGLTKLESEAVRAFMESYYGVIFRLPRIEVPTIAMIKVRRSAQGLCPSGL